MPQPPLSTALPSRRRGLRLAIATACGAAALAAAPAWAQFKVVGPDGRITYTDRPPPATSGQARDLKSKTAPPEGDVTLPFDLRQAATRYPVTLYASTNCAPCETARRYLRERGIPFSERSLSSAEDTEAMQARFGNTDVPTLTIGQAPLQGYSQDQWASMLDAAGYPKTSRLPASYRPPVAQPLAPRSDATTAAEAPAAPALPEAAAPVAPSATASNPGGLRF